MQPELKQRLEHLLKSGPQRIHLIGVCGSGMSGLARLLLAQGHHVSGSDLVPAQDATAYVPGGITYFTGHAASNLNGVALVVYSSAIAVENIERRTATEKNILCVRRAECLVVVSEAKSTYVVAGSHGKTTTSSMLTYVLRQADMNPSHYIGAQVPCWVPMPHGRRVKPFVVEADESDGTLALSLPRPVSFLTLKKSISIFITTSKRSFRFSRRYVNGQADRLFIVWMTRTRCCFARIAIRR